MLLWRSPRWQSHSRAPSGTPSGGISCRLRRAPRWRGDDVTKDAATGDTFTLTGSGDAEPAEADATGGGTIVHHFANGRPDSTGVYVVTGFHSWQPGGGQLPIADGIGHVSEASAGVLRMAIRIFRASGSFSDATLTVNCHLPGATVDVDEGIELSVGAFNAKQNGGFTLFHVQK